MVEQPATRELKEGEMPDRVVICPPDELDPVTAAPFDALLQECDPVGHTIVDFAGVSFCDSTGIRVLVTHCLRHVEAGGSLEVINLRPSIRTVFDITGVSELLGVDST
jgi:anti-anti-sigma factor